MISKKILNTRFDPTKKTSLYFDASKFAVCGILLQDGQVVSCASKTLNNAQKKLPTIERELFGFTFSCKKFRIYLHGHPFQAFTDHKPLVGLSKKLDGIDNQRITAMLVSTLEYSYNLTYLPGKKNILADYGTCQIPESDWEPLDAYDDPLELCPFLDCSVTSAEVKFPDIQKHLYTSIDFKLKDKTDLIFTLLKILPTIPFSSMKTKEFTFQLIFVELAFGLLIFHCIMVKFILHKY